MLRRRLDPERHGSAGYTSAKRVVAFVAFFGLVFVVGLRLATQSWYDGRILPGVVVAGQNMGDKTLAEARRAVQDEVKKYRLKLDVVGVHYELTAAELGVAFDAEATVQSAYRSGRESWLPPLHHDPLPLSYRLDRGQLNAVTYSVANKVGTPPVDAGVVVTGGDVATVSEKSGWSIDRIGLERLIEDDVRSPGGAALALKAREQTADIQAKALGPTVSEAKQLMAMPIILTYQDKTYTPAPAQVGQWLTFEKQPDGLAFKLVPKIDTAKLKSYVQTIANELDVAPVPKKVNVENGDSKVTQEGADGLAIDQDPVTAAITTAVMKQQPLTFTITSHTVPFKTVSTTFITLDYGKYVEVNLSKQHLWVWQDHNIIYDAPITSGATGAGFPTVTGLFSIYYKTTNTHLVGAQYGPRYNYDVFVHYWMPFYSGFGLHDASWRNGKFGGSDYYYGGSHGCVNLPDAAAEFIYNWSDVGTPVWVHN
jgi:lipoprotein-anchoring transpeptidase ErfK/SrfK